MSKGYYIVFVHVYRPADGEKTEAVNWGAEGNWRRQEEVYFVDRIKKQHTNISNNYFLIMKTIKLLKIELRQQLLMLC